MKLHYLFNITFALLLCLKYFTHAKNTQSLNRAGVASEIDFISLATKYCHGRKKNFCSEENLKIMFEIEKKRLEMKYQIYRMQNQIITNILRTFNTKF